MADQTITLSGSYTPDPVGDAEVAINEKLNFIIDGDTTITFAENPSTTAVADMYSSIWNTASEAPLYDGGITVTSDANDPKNLTITGHETGYQRVFITRWGFLMENLKDVYISNITTERGAGSVLYRNHSVTNTVAGEYKSSYAVEFKNIENLTFNDNHNNQERGGVMYNWHSVSNGLGNAMTYERILFENIGNLTLSNNSAGDKIGRAHV